jgi:hypothetical protein
MTVYQGYAMSPARPEASPELASGRGVNILGLPGHSLSEAEYEHGSLAVARPIPVKAPVIKSP